MLAWIAAAIGVWSSVAAGQAPVSLAPENLRLVGVRAEAVRYQDRQGFG